MGGALVSRDKNAANSSDSLLYGLNPPFPLQILFLWNSCTPQNVNFFHLNFSISTGFSFFQLCDLFDNITVQCSTHLQSSSALLVSDHVLSFTLKDYLYWAIGGGLLTPLTSAQHRLNPLAAFTSGAYFLHNGRRWQWICEFYTANFKGIFGGPQS